MVALTLKAVIAFGVEFRETRAKWGAMRDRERPIFGLLIASDGDKCADLADGQSALAFLALSYACEPIPCLSHAIGRAKNPDDRKAWLALTGVMNLGVPAYFTLGRVRRW